MPPTNAIATKRRLDALVLRSQGLTQRDTALVLGITDRQVRRYEAAVRDGWTPALAPLSQAILSTYREENHSRARAQLLALYTRLAIEEARVALAEGELEGLRRLTPVAESEHRAPTSPRTTTTSEDASKPGSPSRFHGASPEVAARALRFLEQANAEIAEDARRASGA